MCALLDNRHPSCFALYRVRMSRGNVIHGMRQMDDLIAGYRRFRAGTWRERTQPVRGIEPARATAARAGHRLLGQPHRSANGVQCRAGRTLRHPQCRQFGAALWPRRPAARRQRRDRIRGAVAAGARDRGHGPRHVRRHPGAARTARRPKSPISSANGCASPNRRGSARCRRRRSSGRIFASMRRSAFRSTTS